MPAAAIVTSHLPIAGGEPQPRSQPQAEPGQRDRRGQRQREHAERRAQPEYQSRLPVNRVRSPLAPVPATPANSRYARDHDDAGQQRASAAARKR